MKRVSEPVRLLYFAYSDIPWRVRQILLAIFVYTPRGLIEYQPWKKVNKDQDCSAIIRDDARDGEF